MSELQFLHGRNLDATHPISQGTFYLDLGKNELWYDDPSGENTEEHIRLFDGVFNDIYKKIEDLHYKQIEIKSFKCKNLSSPIQIGCHISGDLEFNWETSKVPTALQVDDFNRIDEDIHSTRGTIAVTNESFYDNTSYVLYAEDERAGDYENYPELNPSSKSFTFTFQPTIVYGAIPQGSEITSDLLNNFSHLEYKVTSKNDMYTNYTLHCGDDYENLVCVFAYPADWGDAKFTLNTFSSNLPCEQIEYSPKQVTQNSLVNYFESVPTLYNVYYGTNVGLGTVPLVVSKGGN